MKVGTDGVLLGAWAPIGDKVNSILDIGAGTGVIALMMAQRSSDVEVIDALEIDDKSYEQAVDNFEASDWGDRLFCYHASFQEFFQEIDDTYDLLITNPPFYTEDYKSTNRSRNTARFETALPFKDLFIGAVKLLTENGNLAIIIPHKQEENITAIAKDVGLYPEKIMRVKGNPDSKIKRSLLFFGFNKIEYEIEELIIENSRHHYTQEYIELTKDFYL